MAKQVQPLEIILGIKGAEKLAALKSSFRDLTKTVKQSDSDIDAARKSINDYVKSANNSEAVIRGQIKAFEGLREQAAMGGKVYLDLGNQIKQLKADLRGSTDAMEEQRLGLVKMGSAAKGSASDISLVISQLEKLQTSARPGSSAFAQLGKDIAALKSQLKEANVEVKKFNAGFEISQRPSMSLEKIQKQIGRLTEGLKTLNFTSNEFLDVQERIALLGQVQSRTTGRQQVIARERMFAGQAFQSFVEGPAGRLNLPRTAAALNLEIAELQDRLANTVPGSAYANITVEIANKQKELNQILNGSADAYDRVAAAQDRSARVAQKIANLQEYQRSSGGLAPGAGGFRDPSTGAIIARGAGNIADRRAFNAARAELANAIVDGAIQQARTLALPAAGGTSAPGTGAAMSGGAVPLRGTRGALQPIVAAPTNLGTVGGRRQRPAGIEAQINDAARRSYISQTDAVRKNAEAKEAAARVEANYRAEIDKATKANNGSINSSNRLRSAIEAYRSTLPTTSKEFANLTKRINDLDRQSEQVSRRMSRRRMSPMQMTQAAGAAISGGIFGGPEGFLGGAIGAIGGVGGAFAGAAIGAQVGGLRRTLGGYSEYAAQIERLKIALEGIAGPQEEYNRALAAANSVTEDLNVPQEVAVQGITRLTAAVKGAGGGVADAELAFKNINSAIIATGGGAEQVEGAITALVQIFSKGKVSAEEINQIAERLPGTFNKIAAASGRTGPELTKALQDGKVGLNDLMKFLVSLGDEYGALALKIAASSENAGARLEVAYNKMRIEVGKALQPIGAEFQNAFAEFIEDITPTLVEVLPKIGEAALALAKNLDVLAISAGTAFAAMGVAKIAALGGLSAALLKLAAAAGAASVALKGTAAAALLNPWVALAAGIGAATAGVIKYYQAQDELNAFLDEGTASTESIKNEIIKYELEIKEATDKIKGINGEQRATGREAQRLKSNVAELRAELERLRGTYSIRLKLERQGYTFDSAGTAQTYTVSGVTYDVKTGAPVSGQETTDFPGPSDDSKADSAASKKAARDAEREANEIARLQRELSLVTAKEKILEIDQQIAATTLAITDAQDQQNFGALEALQDLARSLQLEKQRAEIITKFNARMREIAETLDGQKRDLSEQIAIRVREQELLKAKRAYEQSSIEAQQELNRLTKEQSKTFEEQFTDRQRQLGLISEDEYNKILMARRKEELGGIQGLTSEQRERGLDLYRQEIDPTPFEAMRQNITQLKESLRDLVDPVNQITSAATAIGDAFSQSFVDAISGAKTAKEALADFFSSVASYFLDMAKQIIAKMIQIAILNSVAKLLPGLGSNGGFNLDSTALGAGGGSVGGIGTLGPNFGIAQRALGGPVNANEPYIVGERGPELFIPFQRGQVMSNEDSEDIMEAAFQRGGSSSNVSNSYGGNSSSSVSNSFQQMQMVNLPFTRTSEQASMIAAEREAAQALRDPGPIDVRYESTVINSTEYVTAEQHRKGLTQAAE